MDEKKADILKYGKHSQYWEEYVTGLPWENDSTEAKFYIAGTLSGFSHDFVLEKMIEQTKLHDDFRNMGFFVWTEFFNNLSHKNLQKTNLNQININGNVSESIIIIGDANIIQNKKVGINPSLSTTKSFGLMAESVLTDFHELRQGFSPPIQCFKKKNCMKIVKPRDKSRFLF